ncbi:MAG: hypothetical protein P8074_06195 [Anaerolineales bacterium]|jgi:hypothetical protein
MGFNKSGLLKLFLTCAFPIHLWSILLVLADFSWVTERTNRWDAFGLGGYALVFAFVESMLVFLVTLLLSFLIPKKWDSEKRLAFIGALVLLISLWAIISQVYTRSGSTFLPDPELRSNPFFQSFPIYSIAALVVAITVALPVYLIIKSDRWVKITTSFINRLSVLTLFYILLDIVGLFLIVIRNI